MSDCLAQVVQVDACFLWSYRVEQDACGICKSDLTSACIHCVANAEEKETCRVLIGTCGHAFHNHCMIKWLKR